MMHVHGYWSRWWNGSCKKEKYIVMIIILSRMRYSQMSAMFPDAPDRGVPRVFPVPTRAGFLLPGSEGQGYQTCPGGVVCGNPATSGRGRSCYITCPGVSQDMSGLAWGLPYMASAVSREHNIYTGWYQWNSLVDSCYHNTHRVGY